MADQPAGPMMTVAYSVQNDGNLIGLHFEIPMLSQVIGLTIPTAETLAKEFGPNLEKTLKQAERMRSGLILAPAETLKTLKGKK
jgi:hypothetical protein